MTAGGQLAAAAASVGPARGVSFATGAARLLWERYRPSPPYSAAARTGRPTSFVECRRRADRRSQEFAEQTDLRQSPMFNLSPVACVPNAERLRIVGLCLLLPGYRCAVVCFCKEWNGALKGVLTVT